MWRARSLQFCEAARRLGKSAQTVGHDQPDRRQQDHQGGQAVFIHHVNERRYTAVNEGAVPDNAHRFGPVGAGSLGEAQRVAHAGAHTKTRLQRRVRGKSAQRVAADVTHGDDVTFH